MSLRILFVIFFIGFGVNSQVSGTFIYQNDWLSPDSLKLVQRSMVKIQTNDTIVRVETPSQLGNQVYIRHLSLDKAYLLLNIGDDKYAIKTDLTKNKDSVKLNYTYKKKLFGGKKIAGFKCKKYEIKFTGDSTKYYAFFSKEIKGQYLEVFPTIPGLAMEYSLPNAEGVMYYRLVSFVSEKLDRNLFGIPNDYKKVTFDELLKIINEEKEEEKH